MMADYSELKRASSAAKNWGGEVGEERWYAPECFKQPYFSAPDAEFIAACDPGTVLALIAENEALRRDAERAAYWRQRAKSAEGHLFSSDVLAGGKALHQWVRMSEKPWDELSGAERNQLFHAAFRVIAAVNTERNRRQPGGESGVAHG